MSIFSRLSGVTVIGLAFFYGVLVGVYQIFPFQQLKQIQDQIFDRTSSSPPTFVISGDCKLVASETLEIGDYRIKRQNKNVPFAVRDGAGALFYNDRLYLIGGTNPFDKNSFPLITSNDVWSSSDDGVSWELTKPNTFAPSYFDKDDWEGRHSAGYVVHNNEMYIIGGDANQGYHINDIWKSRDGKRWELVNSDPPWAPRTLHLSFVYNGYIYVIGGQTMPKFVTENIDEVYYRDIWRSKDGIQWDKIQLEGEFFTPRGGYGGSGFVLNDEVYVLGGFAYESMVNKERDVWIDVWKSSGSLTKWVKVGKMPTDTSKKGTSYHDTAVFDNKLWIIGGFREGKGNTNEIWYTDNGYNWTSLNCSSIAPTHATSVFSVSDGIVIAAGNGWSKEVWKISKIGN